MTVTAAAMILTLLTVANYRIGHRRVLYPPFVYSLIWCLDTYLYGLSWMDIDRIQPITWWAVVLGALCFSIGSWAAALVPERLVRLRLAELEHPTRSSLGMKLLILICILALPFMLHEILSLAASGSGGLLANTRQATTDMANSGETLRAYPASTYLPEFSVWIAILLFVERAGKHFKAAAAIALTCCLLSTGRTFFLMLFSGLTYVQIFRQKGVSIRAAARIAVIPVFLFVCIFLGVIFIDKNPSNSTVGLVSLLSFFTLGYTLGPLAALNYVLTHPTMYLSEPNRTFEFFLKVLSFVSGIPVASPPLLDKFVFVPFPANVYTLYKPLFTDFGFFGMLCAVGVFGSVQTLIYRKALGGGKIALFLSALLMFSTFMSIFDDAYTNFQQLFLMSLLLLLYYGFLNRLGVGLKVKSHIRFEVGLPRFRLRWPEGALCAAYPGDTCQKSGSISESRLKLGVGGGGDRGTLSRPPLEQRSGPLEEAQRREADASCQRGGQQDRSDPNTSCRDLRQI